MIFSARTLSLQPQLQALKASSFGIQGIFVAQRAPSQWHDISAMGDKLPPRHHAPARNPTKTLRSATSALRGILFSFGRTGDSLCAKCGFASLAHTILELFRRCSVTLRIRSQRPKERSCAATRSHELRFLLRHLASHYASLTAGVLTDRVTAGDGAKLRPTYLDWLAGCGSCFRATTKVCERTVLAITLSENCGRGSCGGVRERLDYRRSIHGFLCQ